MREWRSRKHLKKRIRKNSCNCVANKFHYLRDYLPGFAAAPEAELVAAETCYTDAIMTLRECFRCQQEFANDNQGWPKLFDITQPSAIRLVVVEVSRSII